MPTKYAYKICLQNMPTFTQVEYSSTSAVDDLDAMTVDLYLLSTVRDFSFNASTLNNYVNLFREFTRYNESSGSTLVGDYISDEVLCVRKLVLDDNGRVAGAPLTGNLLVYVTKRGGETMCEHPVIHADRLGCTYGIRM